MDFSAFADWDWTAHAGESEDQSESTAKGFAVSFYFSNLSL